MFESFVTFTEVVKLSSNVFRKLQEVNYHDKLIDLVIRRKDNFNIEKIIDLVEDKKLIVKFMFVLKGYPKGFKQKILKSMFNVVDYINKDYFNELLVHSSDCGFDDFVKYLIRNGADIHFKNDLVLRKASCNGSLKIVKLLVERPDCEVCKEYCCHGADIHAGDNDALKLAISKGRLHIVKYLEEKGANLHLQDALNLASRKGRLQIIKYLIEKGADMNAQDGIALTSLSYYNYFDITKYFVENGADLSRFGPRMLAHAIMSDKLKTIKYLIQVGVNYFSHDDMLKTAVNARAIIITKYLIDNGASQDILVRIISKRPSLNYDKQIMKYLKLKNNLINIDM